MLLLLLLFRVHLAGKASAFRLGSEVVKLRVESLRLTWAGGGPKVFPSQARLGRGPRAASLAEPFQRSPLHGFAGASRT